MTVSPAATDSGTSAVASCSFAARDSGANIGTWSIIASWPVGHGAARSIATSRLHARSVSTGRIMPTTMSAACAPKRPTTAGAKIDPSATPPIARPQMAPKARASTSSGTIRWSSVNEATSSMLLAAPTTARRSSAVTRKDVGAIRAIEAPEDERNAEDDREPPASERKGAEGAEQATYSYGCGHVADCALVGVEHLERGDDDEDVEAAPNEGL